MDTYWIQQFRSRMTEFGFAKDDGSTSISIRIRIDSGCFHREHSPEAYRTIDRYLAKSSSPEATSFRLEEHETGPEILTWVIGGLGLTKGIIDLVLVIIKARSEGIRKGDRPAGPLEIVVLGFHEDGKYFEEKIIRIPHDYPLTEKMLREALQKHLPLSADKKKRGKGKKPPRPKS